MDRPTSRAFDKLQKREHLLRTSQLAFVRGEISEKVFRARQAAIEKQYKLNNQEQRAYDQFIRQQRKYKRR